MEKPYSIFVILFLVLLYGCKEKSRELEKDITENLQLRIAAFDSTFAHDLGSELANFFTADARLMWPGNEDMVGREAIRKAYVGFVETFTTVSWKPDRRDLHVYEDRAYGVGRFVEVRKRLESGITETVYGRLVEVWQLEDDGVWYLERLLTSRYAETETSSR